MADDALTRHDAATGGLERLGVASDRAAVAEYLAELKSAGRRPETLRKYSARIGLFLEWLELEAGDCALGAVRRPQVRGFRSFLRDPPRSWRIRRPDESPAGAHHGLRGPLTEQAIAQYEATLSRFYDYLVAIEYVQVNPLPRRAGIGVRAEGAVQGQPDTARDVGQRRRRDFTPLQWRALRAVVDGPLVEAYEARGAREPWRSAARARWLVAAMYGWALRVSDLVWHRQGDVRSSTVRDRNGRARRVWELHVVGKGGKPAAIPTDSDTMEALAQYRNAMGWSPQPSEGEEAPLLGSLDGRTRITERYAFQIARTLFAIAAATIEEEAPDEAADLREAGTHRFRHTRAAHMEYEGVPKNLRRQLMRHRLEATLDVYSHSEVVDLQDALEGLIRGRRSVDD